MADSFDLDSILRSMYQLGPTAEERRRAGDAALLKTGLGILSANQPSFTPRNSLGVLAQGAMPGVDSYQQSVDKQVADRRAGATAGLTTAKLASEIQTQKRRDDAVASLGGLDAKTFSDPQAAYRLALTHDAAGNKEVGAAFLSIGNHAATLQNRRDPSQMERALDTIKKLHLKDSMTPGSLSNDEQTDLHNAIAVVGQVRQALDPATQKLETYQPLTLPDIYKPTLDRYGVKLAKPDDVFPPSPAGQGRRAIDAGSEKELQGFNDASTQIFGLIQKFKPNYGGFLLDPLAQGALIAGRRLPESTLKKMGQSGLGDQAEWWQNYYNWANDVRAAKFGLTLTGNELTAFERSTPKPSDSPGRIQAALEDQLKILTAKQQNRTAGLVAGGYNPAQVRETAGHERSIQPDDEAAIAAVQDASKRGMFATSMPRTQGQQFPKPSPKAIDRLRMNPSEKAQFEAIFGPGSAAGFLGR